MELAGAIGYGLATVAFDGRVLDTWFPAPELTSKILRSETTRLSSTEAARVLGDQVSQCVKKDDLRAVEMVAVRTGISSLKNAPIDAHDVYLRLHLLSHRLVQPRCLSLDGMFDLLTNVAWTSFGPCPLERLEALHWNTKRSGASFTISSVDKIPRMTDYVVPSSIRVQDADCVRLGAYLAPDTLIMQEGFCNFNAGTSGTATVEGSINSGVVVGNGCHIGAGAVLIGTRSGGGKQIISIGKRCLLGANCGIGISLGDDCVVEAGLFVTAGSRVTTDNGEVVKALELSGKDGLLFRRNAQTGAIEALTQTKPWGKPFTGVLRGSREA
jgi:2,3,4,5-tetrahydropyridine-2-carboxylate N-succinyltransferase